jgi:phage tail protein X
MTEYYGHIALAVVLVVLSAFDAVSTLQAFKRGAYEANPVMAWVQKVLPEGWIYARIAVGVFVGVGSFSVEAPYGTLLCLIGAAVWGWVVAHNYGIAWRKR